MDRLGSWITYFALSFIVLAALIDNFPVDLRDPKTDYALGTAAFSMIICLFYVAGHFFTACVEKCMGNMFELGISIFTCLLWTIAISFIQDPENKMATDTTVEGEEIIRSANLYFFSWLVFFWSVYIVGSIFEDRQTVDASLTRWFVLLATSIILVANNSNTIGEACDDEDKKTCYRTRYGIGVGICGIILTGIIILMAFLGKPQGFVHVGASFVILVLYFFGVALLTSASGPARMLGNTYFSLWGGFWIASQTFYEFFADRTKKGEKEEDDMAGMDQSEP